MVKSASVATLAVLATVSFSFYKAFMALENTPK